MGLHILVVDDASFIRDMIKRSLRENLPGSQVLEAPDGNRALALLKSQRVDLILSDWEMPNLSGEDLLKSLRADTHYNTIPFIMISSRGERAQVVKAVQAGVSDYLNKPFTSDELMRKVRKQLQKIGKASGPKPAARPQEPQRGRAFGSVGVLTGQGAEPAAAERSTQSTPSQPKLQAQLRLGNRQAPLGCVVRDGNLQWLSVMISRDKDVPAVFDQAVVDIGPSGSDEPVQLNAYVHSISSAENRPDSKAVKIVLRYVDNDTAKFDKLSHMMGKR